MGLLSMFLILCAQQMCSKCEAVDDLSADCEQCGKRNHVFWQDGVGEFIISGCPDHLQIRFVDTTHIFYCADFWN